MGCGASSHDFSATCRSNRVVPHEVARSRDIDNGIKVEKATFKSKHKLLLLGAAESGKSTIIKRIRIIYDTEFEIPEEIKPLIVSAIFNDMVGLCDGAERLHMPLSVTASNIRIILKAAIADKKKEISYEHQLMLQAVWKDDQIKLAYKERSKIHVPDSLGYFMENLERISAGGYKPSNEDYLHLRIATTGIINYPLQIRDSLFSFIDVGGQRGQRTKWIHQFENVAAVIFISAVSEYDQKVAEDGRTNRLRESLKLFDTTLQSSWFKRSIAILFLNKIDLFEEKVKEKSISCEFKSYKGRKNDSSEELRFIKNRFTKSKAATIRKEDSPIYVHETCATDISQGSLVPQIISDVIDGVLRAQLRRELFCENIFHVPHGKGQAICIY